MKNRKGFFSAIAFMVGLAAFFSGCGDLPSGSSDDTTSVVVYLPGSGSRLSSAEAQTHVKSYGIVLHDGTSNCFYTKSAIAGTGSVAFTSVKAGVSYTVVVVAFGKALGMRAGWEGTDYLRLSPAYVVGFGETSVAGNPATVGGTPVTATVDVYPVRVGGYCSVHFISEYNYTHRGKLHCRNAFSHRPPDHLLRR
ncbi:MAG: hypothetical protein Q8M76_06855 [Spirochaetaceae bacterium]|nr:hypothetical protein [Spirochaetaceae bacterium]